MDTPGSPSLTFLAMNNTLRTLCLPLALALALAVGRCGSDVMTGPSAVVGGVWKLDSIQLGNSSAISIPQPENYTVEFRDDGQLLVKADCNSCRGSYQITGDSLQVASPMACTQASCGAASVDQQYLAILTSAASFGVENGVLTIRSPQGTLRYMR